MTQLIHVCHTPTLFSASGSVDEAAMQQHFERMIESGIAIGVGSPGAGEGQSLSDAEFGRVCSIAVDVAKHRVPIYALAREAPNARGIIDSARAAAEAGVDMVQIFPLQGGHGHIPTREEQAVYYHEIVESVPAPLALMLHGGAGYTSPVDLIAEICSDNAISYLELHQVPLTYLQQIREAVSPSVRLGVGFVNAHAALALGASVVISAEANIIPRTCAAFMASYASGDMAGLSDATVHIFSFARAVRPWGDLAARWIKMALRVLDLPGSTSTLRLPLLMPDGSAFAALSAAFERLGVREYEGIVPLERQRGLV
jgi:dihydrodipicolinate synthase/N-acetylneuraminate lyase